MIRAENLSYSFPHKELYNKISFTLEDDVHCAFIGTNGTGKSTLVNMILHPEDYLYDGKLIIDVPGRIGYVSQFYAIDEEKEVTVFDYLSEEFVRLQNKINQICEDMGTTDRLEELMEEYQTTLDEFNAIDGDFYESNIRKQLKVAGLAGYEDQLLSSLSGGEFKLVQAIREMMISPKFIIMDEPDVFLDFQHLNALRNLINSHKGTLLVITHNRYLLNHCFNKILHLENTEIQEFDGNYVDYNFALLQMKIEQQELAASDLEEIERNRRIVERLRNSATAIDSATRGRSLHARVSLLERLEARKTKSPFVDIKQPDIQLHTEGPLEDQTVRYCISLAHDGAEKRVKELTEDFVTVTVKGRPIRPKTLGQKEYLNAIRTNAITFGVGPAGTGKTYLAVAMAVKAFKAKDVSRIVLTRPAVEAGEKLGFLPGDLQQKVDPYLRPLYDGLFDMLGAETYERLVEKQIIEVAPLAYMRGRTLDDSFIILDEAQNTTPEQMKMFLTRMGVGSKVVVTGDVTQIDLPERTRSGLVDALHVLKNVNGIAQCYFTEKDVVRHRLVQEIIKAYEKAAHPEK